MVFKKKSRYSLTLATILALVILLTPILTGFALANTKVQNEDKSLCSACVKKEMIDFAKEKFGVTAEVLSDSNTKKHINIVENSVAFNNQEFAFGDKVKAIHVKPQDIIQVFGPAKGSDNAVISAFLDGVTGKVLSVTTLTWNGLEDSSDIVTHKYLENGKKTTYSNTWKDLKTKKAEKEQRLMDYMSNGGNQLAAAGQDDIQLLAIDWEYWACQFSSVVACGLGCLVFAWNPPLMAFCELMCQQIWSANLC